MAQKVKYLPIMQETQVQSLGWEDPLGKGTPVFLPGEFHGQRSLVGYSPRGLRELDATERLIYSAPGSVMICRQIRPSSHKAHILVLFILVKTYKQSARL